MTAPLEARVAALEDAVRYLADGLPRQAKGIMSPPPAAPEPERADAEAAATQRGYRTGYADALAATAERDAKVRRALRETQAIETFGLAPPAVQRSVNQALSLLDAAP